MAVSGSDVTPRRVRLRCKTPVQSAEKEPMGPTVMLASPGKNGRFPALLDQQWFLRETVKYLGAKELLQVESISHDFARKVFHLGAPALWHALCISAGLTVNHNEWDAKRLKTVYRIAEAFQGESWTLDSFEEKERFIKYGQCALAASLTSPGPGRRVSSFHFCDARESARLKLLIRQLQEDPTSVDEDEFYAQADVELQVVLSGNGRDASYTSIESSLVTIRGRVNIEIFWEDSSLSLTAGVSLDEDSVLPLPNGFQSSADILRELEEHHFFLFPIDHECSTPTGISIPSGDGGSLGSWLECEIDEEGRLEIPPELLAVVRSLTSENQVRCLLVQRGLGDDGSNVDDRS